MVGRNTRDRIPRPLPAVRRAVAVLRAARTRARGAGRAVGGFVDRVPLRVRLVVAVLALVAAAQVATGAAALAALDRSLTNRLDGQLTSSARAVARQFRHGVPLNAGDLVRLNLPGAVYVQVSGLNGDRLPALSTGGRRAPELPADPGALDTPVTVPGTDGGAWRVVVEPVPASDAVLVMAVSLDQQSATVASLVGIDAVVSGVVLVVLGGVGYLLVRASLRPLRQVEAVAAAIADGQLDQRVPERDPRTEVGRLARSLNAMLARVEGAFRDREASEAQARASEQRMRRFIADASHELRTPLTSIRGFAELYRQGAATGPGDVTRFMRRIESESSRMSLLVEDLLLLARLDQPRPLRRGPVDLAMLAADAVHDARAVAPDRPIELRTSGSCLISGDEPRLRQVLGNLVANALTHTPAGTPVTVRAVREGTGSVLMEVADRGPGLAAEDAARVFERFYRADPSRARQTGGNGLGLAIVDAVVTAHGGTVEVDTAPGAGATFRVRLRALPARSPRPRPAPRDSGPPPGPAVPVESSARGAATADRAR
ncbi:sensor histidine kinase [Planosporangium sp. 12N6]|uniref:sensor histidine kinase n=1 Tax=Planosporangium spinosum TaxID=3402278 RepID=UPI003CED35D7